MSAASHTSHAGAGADGKEQRRPDEQAAAADNRAPSIAAPAARNAGSAATSGRNKTVPAASRRRGVNAPIAPG